MATPPVNVAVKKGGKTLGVFYYLPELIDIKNRFGKGSFQLVIKRSTGKGFVFARTRMVLVK